MAFRLEQLLKEDSLAGTKLFFRVTNIYRNVKIALSVNGEVIKTVNRPIVTPGEMENLTLDEAMIEKIRSASEIEVSICKK